METSCGCDENIFIREEWLEDVVYTRTDRVGGFQHVHVNQALIRAVTALDHDYLVRKVKVKSELQSYQNNNNADDFFIEECYGVKGIGEGKNGNLPADDHWSEDTLTAEEDTDEVEDSQIVVAHNPGNNGSGHCKIVKKEQNDLSTKEGKLQTDAPKNNFTRYPDGNSSVRETVIKKECVDHINDDTRMDEFNTIIRMNEDKNDYHSTLAEDQWSNDLTAPEDEEEIDDGWNSEDGGIALSPGEFIEEIDGWTDATHNLDGYCSVQGKVIKEEQHGERDTNYNTTRLIDGLCSNKRVIGAGNDDPRAMVTEDKHNDMPLSPGEFIEEVYDDDDWGNVAHESDGKLSVHSAVDKNEQHDNEHTKEGLILDEFCTIETKNDNPSSTADKCSDEHSAKTDSSTDTADEDWIYSVPEDYVDYEEYDFSLDEATGENDYTADSDESWTPRKRKRKIKKNPYVCHSCSYKCDTVRLLKSHAKSSKTCKNPYGCNLCDKRYLYRVSLKDHMMKHSENYRKKDPYVCCSCGYECDTLRLLKSHVKSSNTCKNPYGCKLCDKRYLDRCSLKAHLMKHSEEQVQQKKNIHMFVTRAASNVRS